MKAYISETFIDAALIVTLSNEIPNTTLYSEPENKFHLRQTEELTLAGDLQPHVAEIPNEQRLVWPVVAAYSGVRFFSQSKTDECELAYWRGGLLVRVKILPESPRQIFSPATPFADLISVV
ncbi:MAG: hypothetical protein ABR955_15850 [Verrucomicrobiota bacterium]|jgi:hypothetical protein